MNADALQKPVLSSRVHCPKRTKLYCSVYVYVYVLMHYALLYALRCVCAWEVMRSSSVRMYACLLCLGTSDICIPISSIIIGISGIVNLVPDSGMPVHWRVLELMPATKPSH